MRQAENDMVHDYICTYMRCIKQKQMYMYVQPSVLHMHDV